MSDPIFPQSVIGPICESPDFAREEPGRIFRIMAELVDSFETMAKQGPLITIFGSARTKPENPWYQDAVKLGGMLASADRRDRVVIEPLIHRRHSAWLRVGTAAAADKDIDLLRCDTIFLQHIQNDLETEGNLVVHMRKLEKHRRVVEDALLKQRGLVPVKTHLRRGGTRIDDQNLVLLVVHCADNVLLLKWGKPS